MKAQIALLKSGNLQAGRPLATAKLDDLTLDQFSLTSPLPSKPFNPEALAKELLTQEYSQSQLQATSFSSAEGAKVTPGLAGTWESLSPSPWTTSLPSTGTGRIEYAESTDLGLITALSDSVDTRLMEEPEMDWTQILGGLLAGGAAAWLLTKLHARGKSIGRKEMMDFVRHQVEMKRTIRLEESKKAKDAIVREAEDVIMNPTAQKVKELIMHRGDKDEP